MLMTLALAAVSAAQVAASDRPTWATLTFSGILYHDDDAVYGFGSPFPTTPAASWVRRTRKIDGVPKVDWADGKRCPGVERVVKAMQALPPIRPSLPFDDRRGIIMDGVNITLDVESNYGSAVGTRLKLRTNVGTPLAALAELLRKELEPCWSATPPV